MYNKKQAMTHENLLSWNALCGERLVGNLKVQLRRMWLKFDKMKKQKKNVALNGRLINFSDYSNISQ